MSSRKPGTGSRDFFSSGTGHGGASAGAAVPPRRVEQLASEADAARAAHTAGHRSLLQRLRSRLTQRDRERLEAKARSHETLKNYRPPGSGGGGPPVGPLG